MRFPRRPTDAGAARGDRRRDTGRPPPRGGGRRPPDQALLGVEPVRETVQAVGQGVSPSVPAAGHHAGAFHRLNSLGDLLGGDAVLEVAEIRHDGWSLHLGGSDGVWGGCWVPGWPPRSGDRLIVFAGPEVGFAEPKPRSR